MQSGDLEHAGAENSPGIPVHTSSGSFVKIARGPPGRRGPAASESWIQAPVTVPPPSSLTRSPSGINFVPSRRNPLPTCEVHFRITRSLLQLSAIHISVFRIEQ
jgi:hypothetical protein